MKKIIKFLLEHIELNVKYNKGILETKIVIKK